MKKNETASKVVCSWNFFNEYTAVTCLYMGDTHSLTTHGKMQPTLISLKLQNILTKSVFIYFFFLTEITLQYYSITKGFQLNY